MTKKVIVLDPGHGDSASKDSFRVGPSGEREEWINLRVCKILGGLLAKNSFEVHHTRTADIDIPLTRRVSFCQEKKADLFLSVHHASCDPVIEKMNFPFVFIHKILDTPAKKQLAFSFQKEMSQTSHGPALIFSDLWVFSEGLFVLRELEKANVASLISEFSFFSHPEEEKKLKTEEHCHVEAKVLLQSILRYFSESKKEVKVRDEELISFPEDYRNHLQMMKKSLLEAGAKRHWYNFIDEGNSLYKASLWPEALEVYEKALSLNPYCPDILEHLQKMINCTTEIKDNDRGEHLRSLQRLIWP